MTTKYTLALPNYTSFQNQLRTLISLIMLLCLCFMGYAQKGKGGKKGGPKGNIEDITLTTCVQEMENGLTKAWFGYTNPNDDTIILPEGDSYVFLSDKIDDDEYQGVEKFTVLNTFEPGTVEKAFFVVFNSNGHAKWTLVQNGNSETKIRAAADSPFCTEPCVVCPVFGGVGKSFTPLGAELTALATGVAGPKPSNIIFQFNPNDPTEVLIEIIPRGCGVNCDEPDGTYLDNVLDLLQDMSPAGFARVYDADPMVSDFIVDPDVVIAKGYAAYDVYFPISRLLELNDYPDLLNFSRTLYPPALEIGDVTSQGDAAMLTNNVRESFVTRADEFSPGMPVDGSGIKIAAISDSFNKANPPGQAETDVGNGDLPGAANPNGYTTEVDVLKDFPIVASDEGRAMLQIIHDVAPGAELGFSTGVLSPRDMALAIDNFATPTLATETTPEIPPYNIITDDVTYPLAPFFEDGEVAQAIKRFTDNGGIYVTSAGNFADVAEQGRFTNSDIEAELPDFLSPNTRAHVFDGAQDFLREIVVDEGTYFIVLQWDEVLASQNNNMGADTDLDIYLLSPEGDVLVDTNRMNTDGDAAEAMVFQSTQDGAQASIMITSAGGPAPDLLGFRYIVFRATGLTLLGSPGASTISGHAMTPEAITVGAVNHTELQNLPLDPETFSSYAGTLPNRTVPLEVDIAAPDGVEVSVPGFANFKGTSAAAPHIAGAFGLLLSAQDSWYPSGLPKEPLQLFQDNALPIVEGGGLLQAGVGLIEAEAAFKEIAAQTAVLISVSVNPDQAEEEAPEPVLGIDPTEITITGNYIPDDPTVYLGDGEERITLTPISSSETEIVVTVPSLINLEIPIFGNPNLVVYTTPITEGGTDGGESAPISLFEVPVLYLIADDLPHEEGEPITYGDAFTYTYRVEGLPEGLIIGEDLPNVILSSPADPLAPFPNVDTYVIFPTFDVENATAEQLATLATYNVNEVTGRLNITQKDLTITPEPLDGLTYGEAIVLTLNYDYDNSNIPDENKEAFDMLIKNEHSEDFFPVNTLTVINRFNAVVNSDVFTELNGGSWMASENTLTNRFNAVVNDLGEELMGLVNLDIEALEFYTESINNRFNAVVNTNRFNAVVNGQGLVNGLTTLNNRFVAVVNSDISADDNTFNKVFAVLNVDDEAEDPDGDVDLVEFYALNLITGLDVTGSGEGQVPEHNSYAGAFIAPTAANFNITYNLSTLMIPNKAQLVALTFPMGEISYGTILTQEDVASDITGFVYGETLADVFPPDPNDESETPIPVIPYYFVDASGAEFDLGEPLNAGNYDIKIRDPKNYDIEYEEIGTLQVLKAELTVNADNLEFEYGQILSADDIIKTEQGCPPEQCDVLSAVQGEDPYTEEFVFEDGIPYYFVSTENPEIEFNVGEAIDVGTYLIRIREPLENPNYELKYDEFHGELTVTPATLTVTVRTSPNFETNDLIIQQGETIDTSDTSLLLTTISGYKYGDTQEDVFPGGISYIFKDANDIEVEYTVGATGVYFISIMEPQNYKIDPDPVWVLYVNPTEDYLRKIRTYLDCVEYQPGSFDGKDYIANYRYENPNDETIYIAVGPENQLTGTATYEGELPFIFLPGEGTFQIRFDGSDGKILKWELTSLDSTHKSSTTSNANANSNRCDSGNSGNEIGDSAFMISPNPLYESEVLFIKQDFSAVVTLDIFDFFGILYFNDQLDGRNGIVTHQINMSAYPDGMYIIRFSTNQDVQAQILVK